MIIGYSFELRSFRAPTICFANGSFANVLGRFDNVLSRFANVRYKVLTKKKLPINVWNVILIVFGVTRISIKDHFCVKLKFGS